MVELYCSVGYCRFQWIMTSTSDEIQVTYPNDEDITALTITNAVDMKTMEQLIPNLPKIMNSLENGESLKNVVIEELKKAIMYNLSDFVILNSAVTNTGGKLKMYKKLGVDANTYRKDLERQIYKLWNILKNFGNAENDQDVNKELSSKELLIDIKNYFNTLNSELQNYAAENVKMTEMKRKIKFTRLIYEKAKTAHQKAVRNVKELRQKFKITNTELETLKKNYAITVKTTSKNIDDLNGKNSNLEFENFNLKENEEDVEKIQSDFKIRMTEKINNISMLKELIRHREQELTVIKTNFMEFYNKFNAMVLTSDEVKNKHLRLAWKVSKMLTLLSGDEGAFKEYIINFTSTVLNVDQPDDDIRDLVDDVRGINEFLNKNQNLYHKFLSYLEFRRLLKTAPDETPRKTVLDITPLLPNHERKDSVYQNHTAAPQNPLKRKKLIIIKSNKKTKNQSIQLSPDNHHTDDEDYAYSTPTQLAYNNQPRYVDNTNMNSRLVFDDLQNPNCHLTEYINGIASEHGLKQYDKCTYLKKKKV